LLLVSGCRVSKPGAAETGVANEVKHKITVGGKDIRNPLRATDENIADGREHFGHHCGICHGLDGEFTGVPFADKMSPPIPSLSSKDVQDYADGQLKWIIENGINPSGMPAWKGILSDEEMWKLVNFIRHLPPKGRLGIPTVYREEQEQHKHMQGETHHE
jgi:mono/diheme cytochrome c family protein